MTDDFPDADRYYATSFDNPDHIKLLTQAIADGNPLLPLVETASSHICTLQDKVVDREDCCCGYDDPADVCMVHHVPRGGGAEIPESVLPMPPGHLLALVLKARRMPHVRCAATIGVSPKHLSQIVTGKVPLSLAVAVRLEETTGVPALIWNVAESAYRDAIARRPTAGSSDA